MAHPPSLNPWDHPYNKTLYWKAGKIKDYNDQERIVYKYFKCLGCHPTRTFEIRSYNALTEHEFIIYYESIKSSLLR